MDDSILCLRKLARKLLQRLLIICSKVSYPCVYTGWSKNGILFCLPFFIKRWPIVKLFTVRIRRKLLIILFKNPIKPQLCHYTTLWNDSVLKATTENMTSVTAHYKKLTILSQRAVFTYNVRYVHLLLDDALLKWVGTEASRFHLLLWRHWHFTR